MTWQRMMQRNPLTIEEPASSDEAIGLPHRNRITALPVVDAKARCGELFGILALVSSLLPRTALPDDHVELVALDFIHDTLDTLKDRLDRRLREPVSAFTDHELQSLALRDNLTAILLRLHRHHQALPVVDRTRVMCWVFWTALSAQTGRTQ